MASNYNYTKYSIDEITELYSISLYVEENGVATFRTHTLTTSLGFEEVVDQFKTMANLLKNHYSVRSYSFDLDESLLDCDEFQLSYNVHTGEVFLTIVTDNFSLNKLVESFCYAIGIVMHYQSMKNHRRFMRKKGIDPNKYSFGRLNEEAEILGIVDEENADTYYSQNGFDEEYNEAGAYFDDDEKGGDF